MRLDKYLAETAQCTRSEAKTLLAKGRVQVNGEPCLLRGKKMRPGDVAALPETGQEIEVSA